MSTTENTHSAPKSSQPSATRSLSYAAILLGSAVLLATSLLAVGNLATQDAISARAAEDLNASLSQVVPAARHDKPMASAPLLLTQDDASSLPVYRGWLDGKISALAFPITANEGYAGKIQLLLGITPQGDILGVRVLSHAETPGLGDKIEVAKSDWILGFNGLSLSSPSLWAVKKDGGTFDQFTGATITPRAVVKAIRRGLDFYQRQQPQMLAPNTTASAEQRADHAKTAAAPHDVSENALGDKP